MTMDYSIKMLYGSFVLAACLYFVVGMKVGPIDFYDKDKYPIREINLTHLGYENKKHGTFSYHKKYFQDAAEDPYFSYDLTSPFGPTKWKYKFPQCGGPQQSPIDLDLMRCRFRRMRRPLRYYRNEAVPHNVTIENNGYTIEYSFDYRGPRPILYGGPLRDAYVFEQIHFHFGPLNYNGGEHYINTRTYQLEMHLTNRNVKYPNLNVAAQYQDGLAAIAILYEISDYADDWYFVENLRQLRLVNSSITLHGFPERFRLSNIIGSLGEQFIAYRGSMTVPPCSPVSWLVSTRIRKISKADLREFRQLIGIDDRPMAPIFRPLQPRDKLQCVVL